MENKELTPVQVAGQNVGQVWNNLTAKEVLFTAEQRLAKAREEFLAAQLAVMNAQWVLYDLEREIV